ncbi:MAG: hypothetical protein GX216_11675 [Methanomicrobiales archaeon]|jgi:thiamine biosynthesis protein ThiC|nr:hypothetical protein [Methanomicrobiales archaeon]
MVIPDEWVGTFLAGLIVLVLGQAILSYQAFCNHKEEVRKLIGENKEEARNLVEAKTDDIARSIDTWNIKNENCSIRIDTIYARLESFEGKQERANTDIWNQTDQMERRLQDGLSLLKENILVLQTTVEIVKIAGLSKSDDTYQKQQRDE